MSSTLLAASNAIPTRFKPPLFVLLGVGLSAVFSYFASPWIGGDVIAVQRPMTNLSDHLGFVGWRIVELMCLWAGDWDATQAVSLVMLSMAPSMHYRHTYLPEHSSLLPTLAATTAIDVLSIYLPLLFLRPYGSGDSTSTPARRENRFFDSTRVVNALLTSTIYQLIAYTASVKFLTTWLIQSGWELESVARVHNVSEGVLLARAALMIPVGWAASEIIFYSPNDSSDSAPEKNEGPPEGQTGMCAYLVRLWIKSLSPRTRKIVRRTLLVAVYQSVNSTVTLAGTVKGGNLRGAGGVSGVWTVATLVVGAVLGWVGKV